MVVVGEGKRRVRCSAVGYQKCGGGVVGPVGTESAGASELVMTGEDG